MEKKLHRQFNQQPAHATEDLMHRAKILSPHQRESTLKLRQLAPLLNPTK